MHNMNRQIGRIGLLVAIIATSLVSAACADGDASSRDVDADVAPSATSAELLTAYDFDTVEEFESLVNQLAVVRVVEISQASEATESVDERLRLREVTVRVERPIKGLTRGQTITYSDGMYSQVRAEDSNRWSSTTLVLTTEGVALNVGDRAIVGFRDGEFVPPGVFPIERGTLQRTDRPRVSHIGRPAFRFLEGKTEAEAVSHLDALAEN